MAGWVGLTNWMTKYCGEIDGSLDQLIVVIPCCTTPLKLIMDPLRVRMPRLRFRHICFLRLADYIFGKKNVRNEKMAMTTPVQMDRKSGAMSCLGWLEALLLEACAEAKSCGTRNPYSTCMDVYGRFQWNTSPSKHIQAPSSVEDFM